MKHPYATPAMLGYLPGFLDDDNPCSAREQLDRAYQHGGGWHPLKGHQMLSGGDLKYPGDPPTPLLAETRLRDEVIRFYRHALVAVVQPDGTYEISRMD
jgi:hypothetical protein